MPQSLDHKLTRLALEICRHTYEMGVDHVPSQDIVNYIKSEQNPNDPDPVPIHGSKTSFASVVPCGNRIFVCYMGTKTELEMRCLKDLISVPDQGRLPIAEVTRNIRKLIDSLKDWIKNANVDLEDFVLDGAHIGNDDGITLKGKVHSGFLSELKAVQCEVIKTLQDLKSPDGKRRKIVVTGHSQGGAEAALATSAFAAAGIEVEATYTFAAPRAGNQDFADSIQTPVYRFEFGDDIVPHLPTSIISEVVRKKLVQYGALSKLSGLWDKFEDASDKIDEHSYVGVGKLCYGDYKEKVFHVGLSAEEEIVLRETRRPQLKKNLQNWAAHHHLAGTDDELEKGTRGNYTQLASPDEFGWSVSNSRAE